MPPLLSFLKLLGVDAEREWARLAQGNTAQRPAAASAAQAGGGAGEASAASTATGTPEAADEALVQRSAGQLLPRAYAMPNAAVFEAPEPSVHASSAATASERGPAETMKSVLLQLASASDIPPAMKEAAQTALQSLTGQQLLLTQDRAAPFAHVTMFIPLKGAGGGEDGNAAVHIHTRRKGKGELDADNCRLWFQLSLASLGETWLDVTVTNKIVGLHVWNDHPAAEALLAEHRQSMELALKGIGYQLLAFKHSPLPEAQPQPSQPMVSPAAGYAPQTYKGVDLRV